MLARKSEYGSVTPHHHRHPTRALDSTGAGSKRWPSAEGGRVPWHVWSPTDRHLTALQRPSTKINTCGVSMRQGASLKVERAKAGHGPRN